MLNQSMVEILSILPWKEAFLLAECQTVNVKVMVELEKNNNLETNVIIIWPTKNTRGCRIYG